jgi:DNA sulfur modification protein DndC
MQLYNEKHIASLQRVETLLMQGTPLALAWSSGKDSSVLLDLTLTAAIAAKAKGASPYILVTHGDTGVENPEIAAFVKTESRKILAFAKKQGIKLDYHVAKPHLNSSWAVQIISGRKLPSFPQTNQDCSVDWKVKPMASLRKRLMKGVIARTGQEAVTLVGTRYEESVARAKKMKDRGDTHLAPTRNKDGDLVFAALADWSTDEIWEWIGMTRSGLLNSYSDFNDLNRLYADAGGTSCSVVSDTITEGIKKARGQCGARFGCGVCCAVQNDKSLTTMIGGDRKRYGYMSPLNKLREFIVNTQWDFSRRQWVGRTIDRNGMIAIRPDNYSPATCLELGLINQKNGLSRYPYGTLGITGL